MDDDRDDDLFGDETGDLFDAVEQDGPDLFGTEPDELILPPEPVPDIDPEMDLPMDEMDEIPIDPDDAEDDESDAPVAPPTPVPAPTPEQAPPRPEAPLALYRRYRPDTFAQVIGQEHVTEPLQRALVNNRVNHAYLFSGPRGCGKTTSARILARCLNCEQGPTPTPCGVCRSCRELARGGTGSLDVIEMDAATHGLVDDARALRERAFFSPVHSRFKIYIIDEAHMVTPQGFNALLKVVEEPPPHVKFIFATTEPEKVLGTIRSRTHHYPFRLVPPKTLATYLAHLCDEEGVRVDPAVLPLVVRAGAGSVRDSLSVLDQLLGAAGEQGVSYQQATGLLGYTPDTLLDEIMDAFAAGDAQGVFACIDKVIEVGQDPRRFAEDLLRRLRDLIIVAAVPDALATGLVDVAADQGDRLTTQANGMGAGELTRAAEVIADGLTEMRGTTAPRLYLELMCARVLLPGADVDGRGVHARLDRLERRLQMAGADEQPPPPAALPGQGRGARPPAPAPGAAAPDAPAAPTTRPAGTPRPSGVSGPSGASHPAEPSRTPPHPAATADAAPEPPGWMDEPHDEEPPAPRARATDRATERATERAASAPGATPVPDARARPGTAPAAPGASGAGGTDPAQLGTADLRNVWPQVLDAVKLRRRVTWIALQQNTQVHALADGVLTLAVNNPGAMDMLQRGGSDDIIREAVLEVVGIAPKVAIVAAEPGAVASAGPPRANPGAARGNAASGPGSTSPATRGSAASAPSAGGGSVGAASDRPPGPPPSPAPPPSREPVSPQSPASPESPASPTPPGPSQAQRAKQNIRSTQLGAHDEPGEEPDRDDVDLEDVTGSADELLTKVLGARLIAEEDPRA